MLNLMTWDLGDLIVKGEQHITVNHEDQVITLQGVIRPEDVSADNSILSTRIANAKIIYTGQGSVTESQKHGFIYKFLSFLGLV